MDSGVIRVFVSMDCILSFVEDVSKLKDKEQRFFNLIEQSLHAMKDCGTFILKYLNGNTRGTKLMNCVFYALLTLLQIERSPHFLVKTNSAIIRVN